MSRPTVMRFDTLSVGAIIIIVAILGILYALVIIPSIALLFSLSVLLIGIWIIIIAGVKYFKPSEYMRSPFSTLVWGILTTSAGIIFCSRELIPNYTLVVTLICAIIIGVLVIAGSRKEFYQ